MTLARSLKVAAVLSFAALAPCSAKAVFPRPIKPRPAPSAPSFDYDHSLAFSHVRWFCPAGIACSVTASSQTIKNVTRLDQVTLANANTILNIVFFVYVNNAPAARIESSGAPNFDVYTDGLVINYSESGLGDLPPP